MAGRVAYFGNIVTQGLVLDLDAAKRDSYVGTGTAWNDISGNRNNGVLTNGPTFNSANGGSIVFDGTNDYVGCGTDLPSSLTSNPNFTISGWFKLNSNFNNGATWAFGLVSGNPNNINSFCSVQNEISISLANVCIFGTGQFYDSTWKYVVWTKTSGVFSRNNISIYINGTTYTGGSLINRFGNETTTPNILTGNSFAIGKSNSSSNSMTQLSSIFCSNFTCYSRALSSTEILQNYNATKGRFGL